MSRFGLTNRFTRVSNDAQAHAVHTFGDTTTSCQFKRRKQAALRAHVAGELSLHGGQHSLPRARRANSRRGLELFDDGVALLVG